jgi:hypothetical protein
MSVMKKIIFAFNDVNIFRLFAALIFSIGDHFRSDLVSSVSRMENSNRYRPEVNYKYRLFGEILNIFFNPNSEIGVKFLEMWPMIG